VQYSATTQCTHCPQAPYATKAASSLSFSALDAGRTHRLVQQPWKHSTSAQSWTGLQLLTVCTHFTRFHLSASRTHFIVIFSTELHFCRHLMVSVGWTWSLEPSSMSLLSGTVKSPRVFLSTPSAAHHMSVIRSISRTRTSCISARVSSLHVPGRLSDSHCH